MTRIEDLKANLSKPNLDPIKKIDLQYSLAGETFAHNPKEMERLAGEAAASSERLQYQKGIQQGKIFKAWLTWSDDTQKTLRTLNEVHQWAVDNNEHLLEGNAKSAIGILLWSFGDYDRGLELCNQALKLHRENGNWYDAIWVLISLGNFYYDLNQFEASKSVFEEALNHLQQQNETHDVAKCFNGIGNSLLKLGKLKEAFQYQEKALARTEITKNKLMRSRILNDIGLYHQAHEDWQQAKEFHLQSLEIREAMGYLPGQITCLLDIGHAFYKLGNVDKAESYFSKALHSAEKVSAKPKCSRALKGLAHVYKSKGDFQSAFDYLSRLHELDTAIILEDGKLRMKNLKEVWATERALNEAEIEKLKNVDLKNKNRQLQDALDKLKAANARIVQTEKMATVGRLVAGFSHEINNPLGVLKSGTDAIQRVASKLAAGFNNMHSGLSHIQKLTDILVKSCQTNTISISRIQRLMENLRAFIHLEEAQLQLSDVESGIKTVLEMLSLDLPEDIQVKTEFVPIPKMLLYPQEFNQALMHLVRNAVDAMGVTGTLIVGTSEDDGSVKVRVSDSGGGIPAEALPKIFEPDFVAGEGRIKMRTGLFTVAQIMEKHGGRVSVESRVGEGSMFTLILPKERKPEAVFT